MPLLCRNFRCCALRSSLETASALSHPRHYSGQTPTLSSSRRIFKIVFSCAHKAAQISASGSAEIVKLKEAHLVHEHRHGTRHYFGLNPAGFAGLREYADSMWQEALNAFAAIVADQKRGAAKSGAHSAAKDKKGKER